MNNILTQIPYPIILSPMLGIVTPQMVAEVSNLGGLGMLPLGGQTVEKASQLIDETQALSQKPFGVNLFIVDRPDLPANKARIEKMRVLIEKIVQSKGWADHYAPDFYFHPYQDLIDLIIRKGIKMVSFTFGLLPGSLIQKLKDHDIFLIGNATCLEEAIKLEMSGVDALVAQGIEAGGHRCSFMVGDLPQVSLSALVSQISGQLKIPVIAAGGIHDQKTIKSAFDAGASAVQIGSHFMLSLESLTPPSFYHDFQNATATATVLTKAFSGRWARGIQNDFIRLIADSGIEIPDYPLQNVLTRPLRNLAKKHKDSGYNSMWAGQNVRYAKIQTTADTMNQLIKAFNKI